MWQARMYVNVRAKWGIPGAKGEELARAADSVLTLWRWWHDAHRNCLISARGVVAAADPFLHLHGRSKKPRKRRCRVEHVSRVLVVRFRVWGRSGSGLRSVIAAAMGFQSMLQWCVCVFLVVVWVVGVEGRVGRALLSAKHQFKEGDNVPLFANKVGPFHNPRFVSPLFGFGRWHFRDLSVFGCVRELAAGTL